MATVVDVATEQLGRAWGTVNHLNSVVDTPALRAAYNEALPRVTDFWTRLGSDERLYAKYKAMPVDSLTAEQAQAHRNAMRGFVLGGAELQGDAKVRFAQIQEQHAELAQKFSENSLDATDAFELYVTEDQLAGVPGDVVEAAHALAQASEKPGYKLTLKMPCYLPVMQFATSSALREQLYRAYTTRASDQAAHEYVKFDNTATMQSLLALRQEEADLLGYSNFAQVSLVPKMAQSPEQVVSFLRDLATKARPYAEKDLADMRAFAAESLGMPDPQAWDWPYVGEKLKEARYAFSEQEVKTYFTAPKVLKGLFNIVETLFEVSIRPQTLPRYGTPRSSSTASSAARSWWASFTWTWVPAPANAAAHGWTTCARAGCALTPPRCKPPSPTWFATSPKALGGKPALLTHDDVITLFHEFGHGLHHLLTQVNERDVSGISGVEWDAVELPSQFMENFCWEWDVLKHMTAHVDTGEPLPRALYDKMLAAKNFQSGLQTLRQVEFSLFDMLLHMGQAPLVNGKPDVMALLATVRTEVAVLTPPAYTRTPNTFGHIFSGGYSAGYYSYKWAEVLSADAYAAFEEAAQQSGSTLDVPTGRRFRAAILEAGGSRPAMDSFKAFRGREPELAALLRHQGMGMRQAIRKHPSCRRVTVPRPQRPLWLPSAPQRQPPAQRRQQTVARRVNPRSRPSTPVRVPPPHPHRGQIPTRPTSASERTATAGQAGSLECSVAFCSRFKRLLAQMTFCRMSRARLVQMNGLGMMIVMRDVLIDGRHQFRHGGYLKHLTLHQRFTSRTLSNACMSSQRCGNSSPIRLAGCVGRRSITSLRYACGSCPLILAECTRLMMAAARWPARRLNRRTTSSTSRVQSDGFDSPPNCCRWADRRRR
jgi:oligopeptidase A